ncbi:MAG TPA: rubrerythrin family protein [Kofleriaceae bacterium]|nr:rubrerythrin family protein [Kofleriaceae bacterium]
MRWLRISDHRDDEEVCRVLVGQLLDPPVDVARARWYQRTTKGSYLMADLKGSKTHTNLKEAFAGESQANRRYLYFAKVADVEGHPDLAGLFRDTAEGETGHAHGHLDYLKRVGDPATGEPIGDSVKNLKAAIAGETYEYTQMYPGFAKTARDEGFEEIAEWFETLARAERSHAGRFQKGLDGLTAK